MGELRGGKPEEIDEQIDYLFSALDILEGLTRQAIFYQAESRG